MDIYSESALLLERLANSVYDRNPQNPNPLFFTPKELGIVESWIKALIDRVGVGQPDKMASKESECHQGNQ